LNQAFLDRRIVVTPMRRHPLHRQSEFTQIIEGDMHDDVSVMDMRGILTAVAK
jgi:hypothetical protein